MHPQAALSSAAALIPVLIPILLGGLVLWAIARWGKAPAWALVVAVILGALLAPRVISLPPQLGSVLSQLRG